MADDSPILKSQGNVDVQVGGAGNAWKYLSACASMSGPTKPLGDTELRWCQDPERAGGFKISNKIRTAPDQITFDLMTKLSKIDYLEDLNCPFSVRARYTECKERWTPQNYDSIMLTYCNVELTEVSYDDLVIMSPDDEDEIMVTSPASANYEYRVKLVRGSRIGAAADLGDQAANDVAVCDAPQCAGSCGDRKDGCSTYLIVTDTDTTPYAWPNLITGLKDLDTDVITWYNRPILGMVGDVEGVECAGDRVIVSGNAASSIAWNETYDEYGVLDQDEWQVVILTHAPAANRNALFARTAQEVWVACDDGYVAKSIDRGETWSYIDVNTALNAIYAYDENLVYTVGDNGQMYRSLDGGGSWVDITEVATTTANLLSVSAPREHEVYVGTNDGMIYRSINQGDTFAELTFTGDGVGTIDSIEFCGPCGSDVMWVLHNDAGPRGRILRDLSGGNGGPDMEIVVNYTDVIAAGVELNALVCCDVNVALAVGELSGGYPAAFKVA